MPPPKLGGRPRSVNLRLILNGIFYVLGSGCQWRLLPRTYGPWSTVYAYYRAWRTRAFGCVSTRCYVNGYATKQGERQHPATPIPPPIRASPRAVSWRLLRPGADRSPTEQAYVEALLQQYVTIATMTMAVTDFFALVRERRAADLDPWLAHAKASAIPELAGVAEGIRREETAVRAACTSLWSQGQVEGRVNRLKALKRQMYGRAGLDLLRRRVLGLPVGFSISA